MRCHRHVSRTEPSPPPCLLFRPASWPGLVSLTLVRAVFQVYKLTEQNTELQYMIEQLKDTLRNTEAKHELEALQRDYDEFKQPDIDGDDKISRAEFNMYVKNYLANYPGLSEKDYPKFEDFDHDGDGYVSFQEYSQQMALQAQQAELEQMYGKSGDNKKAQALKDMYADSKKGIKF
jgi:Ca2+-binding EF-hand superfamily protein